MPKLTLTQLANILKSEWILLVLGLASVGLVTLAIVSSKGKVSPPRASPSPQVVAWKNNIIAGTTTVSELQQKLGQPQQIEQEEGKLTYLYPSTNKYRPHQVEISQEKVAIIKEQVIGSERGKLSDYLVKYGQPQILVYGRHGAFAPGHFWGNWGLLVFGNPNTEEIVEIWHFAPTTVSNFLSSNPEIKQGEPQNF